jgi:transposase
MQRSLEADLLKTLPCVGTISSMVLMLEIGRVDRFPNAAHLARYAGLVLCQRSHDAIVAPAGVLARHLDDQGFHF